MTEADFDYTDTIKITSGSILFSLRVNGAASSRQCDEVNIIVPNLTVRMLEVAFLGPNAMTQEAANAGD